MTQKRRKGNIAYLFEIADTKKAPWYASIATSILGILLEAIPFVSIYFIVETVLKSGGTLGETEKAVFLFWGIFSIVALALSVLCTLIGGYGAHKSTFRLIYALRKKILAHIGKLPMGYFSANATGKIQKQMESGMGKIEKLLSHSIPNLIGAAPLFFGLMISLLLLNFWLWLAVLLPVAAAFVIQGLAFSGKRARGLAVDVSEKQGAMNKFFNEFLRGIAVVKIYGQSNKSVENITESVRDYRDFMLLFTQRVSTPYSVFKVLMMSVLSFVLPVATGLIMLSGAELKLVLTILMFLIVVPCLYAPILELMQLGAALQHSAVAVDEVESVFNLSPLEEAQNPQIPSRHDICFENVSFSYQSADDPMRRFALRNMSFSAKSGTVTALVGPSGGGKSTVGQLLCRFWDVNEGRIIIGDHNIKHIATDTLMDKIAFVFQDSFLFSGTVLENICMNRQVTKEQAVRAAKAAMCHDFIEKLPLGYDTILGDGGAALSGGETQRIAIARAILKDSPIIVLDEATAFTDADNEALIQDALGHLLAGKTVLIIAHRLSTIQKADQILVLEEGLLVQQGTHPELIQREGLYKSLWNLQNDAFQWKLKGNSQNMKEGISLA